MTDYKRVEELKKYLKKSANAISKELGLSSPQIFYDIKAGKCGISKDLAAKIQEKYFNISISWLLTGEGEMLKNTESPTLHNSINRSEDDTTYIDQVVISREVFEQITKMTDTILSQQATIKELTISIQNLTSKI